MKLASIADRKQVWPTVVLVVFFAGTVAIRFIGTHGEYDKIKDIKNI